MRAHGWAVTAVSDKCECDSAGCSPPDCSFGYTTGLGLHALPELAVYGLDAATSFGVLNELGDLLHGYEWTDIVDNGVAMTLRSIEVPVRLIEIVDKSDLLDGRILAPPGSSAREGRAPVGRQQDRGSASHLTRGGAEQSATTTGRAPTPEVATRQTLRIHKDAPPIGGASL
ncbi:DUF4262 domain-containing protein [Williamsia soli]|uniref:DUF4262 domain-containing protein n=1 Tax=Williamsia soli TaxID=364929 RepID=UPI0027DDFE32|nr:DUF4262 domain-containing protein [Williamsia soli]